MTQTVTTEYLDGIREGRNLMRANPDIAPQTFLDGVQRTIASGFPASSLVGQMLRGERDFWRQQIAKGKPA